LVFGIGNLIFVVGNLIFGFNKMIFDFSNLISGHGNMVEESITNQISSIACVNLEKVIFSIFFLS
jgi:hypothetical protein